MSLRDPTKAKDCHWEDFKAVLPEKKKKKIRKLYQNLKMGSWEVFQSFSKCLEQYRVHPLLNSLHSSLQKRNEKNKNIKTRNNIKTIYQNPLLTILIIS